MKRDRACLIEPKQRDRLFTNTIKTGDNRERNHAILRVIFGSPMRLLELARVETYEWCDREGKLLDLSNFTIQKEVSFNDRERYFPIVDKAILKQFIKETANETSFFTNLSYCVYTTGVPLKNRFWVRACMKYLR